MTPFAALGLSPSLVRAAHECGYAEPTPVQTAAVPAALAGDDVLATAQTGSGKTAAFALPVLQRLQGVVRSAPRATHALVLVPTRELAAQAGDSLRALARHLAEPVKVAVVFGGVSINPQMMNLRGGAELVVATPGRLLDLVDRHAVRLGGVAVLVLDEADRLLDAGFAEELARVLALLPPRRQTLLFSATFPPALQALASRLLHEPVRIDVLQEPAAARPVVEQRAVEVDSAQRTPLLRHLIQTSGWSRVLVFVATRYASDHLADKLRRSGVAAAAFHADASQGARTRVLAEFKAGQLQVLVATDLAARGIDIVQLPVVVNYDLPRSALDHLHRIGRTARAGAGGLAVSFIGADGEAHFRLIEKRQGFRVARERIAGFEPVARIESIAPGTADGGVKGRRKSKKDKLRDAAARGG